MPNVQELVTDYLRTAKTRMMQIATAVDNQPWCCTVYYAVDDELNLIWISTPARRHSEEIAKNAKVAGVIAYDQQPGSQAYVRGLQFEAIAEQLTGDEEEKAVQLYTQQLHRKDDLLADIRSGKNPHRVYRATIKRFVLFDSQNFPDQPRQDWLLAADNA